MRVVVTGGAGFIGAHLCERLIGHGHTVLAIDDLSTGTTASVGHLRENFTLRVEDACGWVPVEKFDAIFHLASPASPKAYQGMPIRTLMANTAGTANALQWAKAFRARVVLASSSEVYGDQARQPLAEQHHGATDPRGPRSAYTESKRALEAFGQAYALSGLRVAIARLFNVYGPGMRHSDGRAIPTLLGQALASKPLTVHGAGTQTRSFCWVDDAVTALVELLHRPTFSGAVNIGNPEEISIRDLADLIRRSVTGCASEIVHVPARDAEILRRVPDISHAGHALGWEPITPLNQGLQVLQGRQWQQ